MSHRLQPREVTALALPDIDAATMPADLQAYFDKCESRLGFVPNVLVAHAFDALRLRQFAELYNRLMTGESALSKLEREMIAVVVSARNRCHYCLVSHGQALRDAGFSDRTLWDIVETASFYAMSNRMAIGMGMKANPEYHGRSR